MSRLIWIKLGFLKNTVILWKSTSLTWTVGARVFFGTETWIYVYMNANASIYREIDDRYSMRRDLVSGRAISNGSTTAATSGGWSNAPTSAASLTGTLHGFHSAQNPKFSDHDDAQIQISLGKFHSPYGFQNITYPILSKLLSGWCKLTSSDLLKFDFKIY